jgi:dihydrofolate synthase/folylpolyglutamate synthase
MSDLGLDYLNSLTLWNGRAYFDLAVMTKLMQGLGNPQIKPKVVHIAGTNGKGSTASAIACGLSLAGYQVGLNISPHLFNINERISINGRLIETFILSEAAIRVREVSESLDLNPSYHEAITAIAFMICRDVDYLVLEVGLGGRLDASNIIPQPELAIIASIGLDHTAILGNTAEKIATEKAGIIKKGANVIVGEVSDSVFEVINSMSNAVGAQSCRRYGVDFLAKAEDAQLINCLTYKEGDYQNTFRLNLEGQHQVRNMAVAVAALRILNISEDTITKAIYEVNWPGRLEKFTLSNGRYGYLDGAHNEDGVRSLISFLDSHSISKVDLVFGAINTKPWSNMLNLLSKYINKVFIIEPNSGQAVLCNSAQEYLSSIGISSESWGTDYQGLINRIQEVESSCPIIVAGSLYMVGEFRGRLFGPLERYWS